ncbi:hypothetical protein Tco_0146459 [Tanacetum coccineum]
MGFLGTPLVPSLDGMITEYTKKSKFESLFIVNSGCRRKHCCFEEEASIFRINVSSITGGLLVGSSFTKNNSNDGCTLVNNDACTLVNDEGCTLVNDDGCSNEDGCTLLNDDGFPNDNGLTLVNDDGCPDEVDCIMVYEDVPEEERCTSVYDDGCPSINPRNCVDGTSECGWGSVFLSRFSS